jgi:hypothetical protein
MAPGVMGQGCSIDGKQDPPQMQPARISHTLAGAGSVLAAPRAFRALPIQPVSAAALKTLGTTMPFAIIPQGYEKCGQARPLAAPKHEHGVPGSNRINWDPARDTRPA